VYSDDDKKTIKDADTMLSVFQPGSQLADMPNPLSRIYWMVWNDIWRTASSSAQSLYKTRQEEFLASILQQVSLGTDHVFTSVGEMLEWRIMSVGVLCNNAFTPFIYDISIPAYVLKDEAMVKAERAIVIMTIIQNDILRYHKENAGAKGGHFPFNLVSVMRTVEPGLSQ